MHFLFAQIKMLTRNNFFNKRLRKKFNEVCRDKVASGLPPIMMRNMEIKNLQNGAKSFK
jgi:hypothetical protein